MEEKAHLVEIIEKFYACTHIPIKAYQYDGLILHSLGYNQALEELSIEEEMIQSNILKTKAMHTSAFIENFSSGELCYTLCPLCPEKVTKGFYMIGPYVTSLQMEQKKIGLMFKPHCCVPHLVDLLHNIGKDNLPLPSYSLHVKRALDYINDNYRDPITLDDISQHLNINRCYFCHIFKQETGKTFSECLNEIRIKESKELLSHTNLSIMDIAISVGFNNQNYYTMVFKKLNQKTPLEFRKLGN